MATTRVPFAHDAVLAMGPDEDDRAPGGAITVALCGSGEHEPPCPLAPHHTRAERNGDRVRLRVLFAAGRDREPRVRALSDDAVTSGGRWRLLESAASAVRPGEQDHAARLARS